MSEIRLACSASASFFFLKVCLTRFYLSDHSSWSSRSYLFFLVPFLPPVKMKNGRKLRFSLSNFFCWLQHGDSLLLKYGKESIFLTTISKELIKKFKILAVNQGKRQNKLPEEALKDFLKKYDATNDATNNKVMCNE